MKNKNKNNKIVANNVKWKVKEREIEWEGQREKRNSPTIARHQQNNNNVSVLFIHLTSIELCVRDALDFYIFCVLFIEFRFALLLPRIVAFVRYNINNIWITHSSSAHSNNRHWIEQNNGHNMCLVVQYLYFSHITLYCLHLTIQRKPKVCVCVRVCKKEKEGEWEREYKFIDSKVQNANNCCH